MSLTTQLMAKSPVGYWRDATGTDVSGNARDLTPFGSPTAGVSLDASSPTNPSITLTGGNNLWNPDHYTEFDLTNAVSIYFRFKPGVVAGGADLVRKGTGVYGVYCDGTKLRAFASADSGVEVIGATTIVVGTTYDVLMTYDRAHLTLYLNGVQDATGALTGDLDVNNGAAFTIGLINTGYTGLIDEVALFGTALTSGDATAFHTAGVTAPGGGYKQHGYLHDSTGALMVVGI